jgi:hypothetical protein
MTTARGSLVAAVGMGVLLAATPATPNEVELLGRDRTCAGIYVSSVPETRSRVFSARKVLDLRFRVLFGDGFPLASDSTIELKIFNPNGHLYQSLLVPVQGEARKDERERQIAGYPFPLKVMRVKHGKTPEAQATRYVDAPNFPVGGTQISTNSLYGAWRVEAWPSNAEAPCETSFGIRE